MATRVIIDAKLNEFAETNKVKTYYYKNSENKEILIGNEKALERWRKKLGCNIYSSNTLSIFHKITRAKRRITNRYGLDIDSTNMNVIRQHIDDIISKLNVYKYKYSFKMFNQCNTN
tara:strand:+ start:169 stop:519 length:351 start_codon:yes stop_codon:yes gene_type:complete